MNTLKIKNNRGFALLYIILILASIMTVASFIAGQTGVFAGNRMRSNGKSAEVRMIAMSCGEQLLMQVRNNTAISGSGTINYGGGSCSYSISGSVPNKTINITAVKNYLYRRIAITITQTSPTINATWLETQ